MKTLYIYRQDNETASISQVRIGTDKEVLQGLANGFNERKDGHHYYVKEGITRLANVIIFEPNKVVE